MLEIYEKLNFKYQRCFWYVEGELRNVHIYGLIEILDHNFPIGLIIDEGTNLLFQFLLHLKTTDMDDTMGEVYMDREYLFISTSSYASPNVFCAWKNPFGNWVRIESTKALRTKVKLVADLRN